MRRSCVIDNSTLVNLTELYERGIFRLLRNLFHKIHIPLTIRAEYEVVTHDPRRKKVIDKIRLNTGFLALCSEYDSIIHEILKTKPGIDAGEAEAAAQHKKVYSHYVLSDDQAFINSIQLIDPYTKILGTLELIAWLDLGKFVLAVDRDELLRTLHRHSPVNSKSLRKSYQAIARELSMTLTRKELDEKSSIKRLSLEYR